MRISIPYVVVTAVKDRKVYDVVFVDTKAVSSCKSICKTEGAEAVLSTRKGKYEKDSFYTEVAAEDLFYAVADHAGATLAWDDIQNKIISVADESEVTPNG